MAKARKKLRKVALNGHIYKTGDRIDLYRDDEGFIITSIEESKTDSDIYIFVRRKNGRADYIYIVEGDGSGFYWLGTKPPHKKKEEACG